MILEIISQMINNQDLKDVVVPINQGVFSAFGLNMSDMRVDVSKTANMRSDFIDLKQIKSVFKTLEKNSLNQIKNEGYTGLPKLYKILEMRYLGQNYGVDVTKKANKIVKHGN